MTTVAEAANYKMTDDWDAEAVVTPRPRSSTGMAHQRKHPFPHDGRRRPARSLLGGRPQVGQDRA